MPFAFAATLYGLSSGILSASCDTFSLTSTVHEGFPAIVFLHYWECHTSIEFSRLLLVFVLGVVVNLVLSFFFGEDDASKMSKYITLTFCTEILSLLFFKMFFRGVSVTIFLSGTSRLEVTLSTVLK